MTTTATAQVTAAGTPVSGDTIAFTAGGVAAGTGTTDASGNASATFTSTTTAGPVSIVATDSSAATPLTATATLTQTAGPATTVTVTANPNPIVANGTSTSVATATVTDANGNPVSGDTVTFTSSDQVSATTSGPTPGTYTATITSSTTAGPVTIIATDSSAIPKLSSAAALTQTPGAATNLSVVLSPSSIPADDSTTSTATARVADALGHPVPRETIVFSSSDPGQRIGRVLDKGDGTYTTTVTSSTTPGSATITATDQNAGGLSAHAIVTQTATGTTTALAVSNATPNAGSKVTYTATVNGPAGSKAPSGAVAFLDGTKAIGTCAKQPLKSSGATASATCTVSYASSGTHEISARYLGDPNFAGSTSGVAEVSVQNNPPPGRLTVTMQWEFHYTPHYTTILQFLIKGVPTGANVMVSCHGHGHGCPYAKHTLALLKQTVCTKKSKKCVVKQPSSTVRLQPAFGNRKLGVGTRVTVDITRAGYVGKHYVFTIVARHAPRVSIGCLTPSRNKPESCPSS